MKIFKFPQATKELSTIEKAAEANREKMINLSYGTPNIGGVDAQTSQTPEDKKKKTGATEEKEGAEKSKSSKKKTKV